MRIHNQIQVKDFKRIETYSTLTINQQINLANYCGSNAGAKRYLRPRGSDAYGLLSINNTVV